MKKKNPHLFYSEVLQIGNINTFMLLCVLTFRFLDNVVLNKDLFLVHCAVNGRVISSTIRQQEALNTRLNE